MTIPAPITLPGRLTETPPPSHRLPTLLRMDATVTAVTDDDVTVRTAVDMRIVIPRSVFDRRDCGPKLGQALSIDIEDWDDGDTRMMYVSGLTDKHRFGALTPPPATEDQ